MNSYNYTINNHLPLTEDTWSERPLPKINVPTNTSHTGKTYGNIYGKIERITVDLYTRRILPRTAFPWRLDEEWPTAAIATGVPSYASINAGGALFSRWEDSHHTTLRAPILPTGAVIPEDAVYRAAYHEPRALASLSGQSTTKTVWLTALTDHNDSLLHGYERAATSILKASIALHKAFLYKITKETEFLNLHKKNINISSKTELKTQNIENDNIDDLISEIDSILSFYRNDDDADFFAELNKSSERAKIFLLNNRKSWLSTHLHSAQVVERPDSPVIGISFKYYDKSIVIYFLDNSTKIYKEYYEHNEIKSEIKITNGDLEKSFLD